MYRHCQCHHQIHRQPLLALLHLQSHSNSTSTRTEVGPSVSKAKNHQRIIYRCLRPWTSGIQQGLRPPRVSLSSSGSKEEEEEEEDGQKAIEDEFRKEDWISRGWAPWEAILSLQADFAIKSLNETHDDMQGLHSPDSLDAFHRLTPNPKERKDREKNNDKDFLKNHVLPKQQRMKIGDEEYELVPTSSQWECGGVASETTWNSPLVFTLIPPRDWPPPGWKVNEKELAFIREAHKLDCIRVNPEALETPLDPSKASFPRFQMFIKQYNEWVAANKDTLDTHALEVDYHYHPGRRRTGSKYVEGMYELPFIYPGQIYGGYVTSVHLHLGAFVFIGCVNDGWVPIKGNDWYWVRHHIKVGMHVQVEVLAKRDPYRFRFPIELRFVNPNIDHLIFNRFECPPIFGRDDTNYDELARETGRPYLPRRRPKNKPKDQLVPEYHPYSAKIGQIHALEQAILDEEENDLNEEEEDEYVDELNTDEKLYDSDNDGYWIQAEYDNLQLPKLILTIDEKDLDMDAARVERKLINKLQDEAKFQGNKLASPKLRRENQMDELDAMHKCRFMEQREAFIRDINCRRELGLPIEEPGKYANDDLWLDEYDSDNPRYRNDYWGDPTNLKKEDVKVKKSPIRKASNSSVTSPDVETLTKSSSVDVEDVGNTSLSKSIGVSKEENTENDEIDNFVKGNMNTTTEIRPLINGTESFNMGGVRGMFDGKDNWNDFQDGVEEAESDTQDI